MLTRTLLALRRRPPRLDSLQQSAPRTPHRMASSSAAEFIAKVQALRRDLAGQTDEERTAIQALVKEVPAMARDIKALDAKLTPLTYLNVSAPSIADVGLYCELHPQVSQMDAPAYYATPAVTRYFDHIQHLQPVTEARTILSDTPFLLKEFDLAHMPALERKVEVKEKKAKKEGGEGAAPAAAASAPGKEGKKAKKGKEEPATETAAAIAEPAAAASEPQQGKKKEKKEKAPPAPAAPSVPMPSMIDLRVGKVLEVSKHPDAESLYVEKIDIGEETGPRTVCSGLVAYMKEEEIRDATVIVVCNLKPVTMRGVKSFAMLLCATSKEGKDAGIEFVLPPPGSKPGERIYFEGEKYESLSPEPLLNPKKKVFETIQPGFLTLDSLEAAWIDPETKSVHKIRTKDGVCKVAKFAGASLS